jgi:hypothetical protein
MYGLAWIDSSLALAPEAREDRRRGRASADRYALLTAGREASSGDRKRRSHSSIGQARSLSGILFRLSSRATPLV